MTTTNHGDQLGEIYPTMLSELNCKRVSILRFHCCSRHGHGLWLTFVHVQYYANESCKTCASFTVVPITPSC